MTVREYLKTQFNCAIAAVLGELEDLELGDEKVVIDDGLIDEIAEKAKFYVQDDGPCVCDPHSFRNKEKKK